MPVSARALLQRINRKLEPYHQAVKKARPRAQSSVGAYYTLDIYRNAILRTHVDVEALARELGVKKAYEAVISE